MTRAWMVALVTAVVVACDAGAAPASPDPMLQLEAACAQYAAIGCQKNVQCAPPAQPDCESETVADCLNAGAEHGTLCVASAAAGIENCTPMLAAMTCDDYCDLTATGSLRCSAPCTWICAPL
jgi:hypothetical protein